MLALVAEDGLRGVVMAHLTHLAQPDAAFAVRVCPGARHRSVTLEGDAIRITVAEPPTDGRATEAARISLAKALGVAKSRLVLVRGAASRHKLFRLV